MDWLTDGTGDFQRLLRVLERDRKVYPPGSSGSFAFVPQTCLAGHTYSAWRELLPSPAETKPRSLTSVLLTQPEPIQVDGSMTPTVSVNTGFLHSLTPNRSPVPDPVLSAHFPQLY